MREEPIYNGGAKKTYTFKDYDETEYTHEGWATRRWDAEVQKRLRKLYAALGKEFDGIVEGINTEETSVGFGNRKFRNQQRNFPRRKSLGINGFKTGLASEIEMDETKLR